MINKVIKNLVIVGNHDTPAIELIRQLRENSPYSWNIDYISHLQPNQSHLTETIIPIPTITFHNLPSGKYDRRYLPNTIKGIPLTLIALSKSILLLLKLRPDMVVSFGGYTSVPVIIAARLLGLKTIIHEQTLTISLSTKICSYFTHIIALSFKQSLGIDRLPAQKIIITGNLLRREIFFKESHYSSLVKNKKKLPVIYIHGGRQGAGVINQIIKQLLPRLHQHFFIIHQTGNLMYPKYKSLTKKFPDNYIPTNYIALNDIGWLLQNADILISRAGANICQEIVALNKKSILIPLPLSQQHEQELNAAWVKEHIPSTEIIPQQQLSPTLILSAINRLIKIKLAPPPATNLLPNYRLLKIIHENI